MSKHTPGPWEVDSNAQGELLVMSRDGAAIAVVPVGAYGRSERSQPNARLIAAAPELLEALRHVMQALDLVTPGRAADSPAARSLRVATAAIAKAEGK
jgi:hypothetical protein